MNIAILGTGVMGSGMAEGFLNAGHKVVVFNRSQAKLDALVALGARAATTPAQAIAETEAAIIVVSDGAAMRDLLLNDETRAVLQGRKLLNASTTTPMEISEFAALVAESGGNLAETSILTGGEGLRQREGRFLLGCDEGVRAFWTETLEHIGHTPSFLGGVGSASKGETAMLFGSIFISLTTSYSAAVALKLGVPQDILAQQLGMVTSGAEYLLPSLFARDYGAVMASVSSFKGVCETAIGTAGSLGLPTGPLEAALALFNEADRRGYGAQDGTAVLEVLLEPTAP